MSAIASFHRFREEDLPGLREAAVPARRFLRAPQDGFWDYVRARGAPVLEFDGSGYVFATLLSFLEEKRGILLMKSSHDDLANFLSEKRASTFHLFTSDHRDRYLPSLEPGAFDEADLRTYYNDFNETDEPASGEAMLDGISALRMALGAVLEKSVVLLHIG